jgi:NADPH:quinone reductase-like Zn-dependent oxidoreductase
VKAVSFAKYGGTEVLDYGTVKDPVPRQGEALIAVEACGVNHFDIDLREGTSRINLNLPHIPGLEVVGRIAEVRGGGGHLPAGKRVLVRYEHICKDCRQCLRNQGNLCPDTQMFGVNRPGGYAEFTTANAVDLIPVSEILTASEWAATQIAFGTAWHMLVTRAGVRAGETVLINAAGSGVSSAATQIAVLSGAEVIVTAGTQHKLDRARQFGAQHAINYREVALFEGVMDLTGGHGVDLVVEHVGGSIFTDSLRALRPGGRLVTCGGHAGELASLDLIELFRSERQIIGCRTWTRAELVDVFALIEMRQLQPVVDKTFPLSQCGEAQQYLVSRQHYGKVVIDINE